MTTGTTSLLQLALPVQGELDGQWGNTVNNAITDYVNIAIAGTLSFAGDGAITLANTLGDDIANNIVSTTAQYMAIRVTGTLTTPKIITGPSYSKAYIVDNAATGSTVTFKASGQTGVSVAVGEKCTVYYNGTDYVKVASSVVDGVTSVSGTGTVNGITLTGTVTSTGSLTLGGTLTGVNLATQVTGTLPVANGGTGVTTSTGSGNNVLSTSPTLVTPILGTPTSGTLTNATGLPLTTGVTGLLPVANGGTGTATPSIVAGSNISVTGTWPNQTIASTASGSVTSVTGSGNIASSGGTTPNITFTGILPVASGGTATATPGLVAGSNVTVSGTWPNQTIAAVGGGGTTVGIYPAIASGALANGDKVVINSDGTVSVIANSVTFGSEGIYSSPGGASVAVYDSVNNRVVLAYSYYISSTFYSYVKVGTVSGTSISWGTAVQFGTNDSYYFDMTFDTANGKVVIAYGDDVANSGSVVVGTVSGTSISFGTPVAFLSGAYATSVATSYDALNGKVVVFYRNSSTTQGNAIVGTVSGTSISFGTAVVFSTLASIDYASSTYVGSGKVVVAYEAGSPKYGYAIVGTVSGTSISFGTAVVFNSASSVQISATFNTVNSRVVIGYSDVGNSTYGTAIVGTVSGTAISFGSAVVYRTISSTNSGNLSYSPTANKIVIATTNSSGYEVIILGTVSGSSITFSSPTAINAISTSTIGQLTYDSSSQKIVVAYENSSGTGYAQVVTIASNLTATNFIGISDAAYANGATATIQTVGSTDDAQSGLTAGLAYYVQPDGRLESTAGSPSVFAGTAVSATKLIIKG
jgi:hypothetical protein